jgi:hypothetical protein
VFQKIIVQVGLKYGKGVLECIVFERKKKNDWPWLKLTTPFVKEGSKRRKIIYFNLQFAWSCLAKLTPHPLFLFCGKKSVFSNYFVRIIRSCKQVAIALTYYCISIEAVQLSRTAVQGLELKSLNEEII